MSGNLVRVVLPNKDATVVQVQDEMLLEEVMRLICERRQLDHKDHFMTNPHSKKKDDPLDLSLQYRQYDDLKEVHICRIKKKSFILPATSKNTSMRTFNPAEKNKVEEPPKEPKMRGRLRSISLTFKGTTSKNRESILPVKTETGEGHEGAALTTMKINPDILTSDSSLSELAEFMSSKVIPADRETVSSSPTISIPEIVEEDDDAISIESGNSINSVEDVAREKIVRKPSDHTKTMTLQRKKLRPRASSVISRSENETVEEVVVRVSLPNGNVTAIKVQPIVTMEVILRTICEKKAISFEDHTLQLPDRDDPVDLDRPLGYYKIEPPVVIVVPSKEKSYSTMCVSEGDKDVMILSFVSGKLEVAAATEEKLIERMTDEQETDRRFVDIFLLTYRSFMSPEDFFDFLITRFNSEPPEGASEEELKYYHKCIDTVREKVVSVITKWVNEYWWDFKSSSTLLKDLEDFVEQALRFEDFTVIVKNLKQAVTNQTSKVEQLEQLKISENKSNENFLLSIKPKQIAEQLCILNYKLFQNVNPIEFLNQLWRKPNSETNSFCTNLLILINRFNKESAWVATEICETSDFNKRTQVLKRFMEILKELYDMNNLFSVFAILAGLNTTPVQRLKKTWAALPSSTKKIHEEIEKITDPSKNMRNYREHISKAHPPILPFLPIFLKDLIFVNDGNSSRYSNNLVNFEKMRMLGDKIQEFVALSAIPFAFEELKDVQIYLEHCHAETIEKLTEKTQPETLD